MQPKERRETGEQDLFRSRLDQIIDLQHPLVRLARAIDYGRKNRKISSAEIVYNRINCPPMLLWLA
jgi:IS5 family transposase